MTNRITWCKLAGRTISWVVCDWAGGVDAGAGVGGLLSPAANRAAVAMAISPRLHLSTETSQSEYFS